MNAQQEWKKYYVMYRYDIGIDDINHFELAAFSRGEMTDLRRRAALERALAAQQRQIAALTAERDEARAQLEQARKALSDVKRVMAVGRNVGEDKDQAYMDAEEIADIAIGLP